MKRHECPTCGQRYECNRPARECGSPLVYDCFFCYVSHYAKQLEAASRQISERFGFDDGDSAYADVCYAD